MGIEKLNAVAHAAGFALVGTDDLAKQPETRVEIGDVAEVEVPAQSQRLALPAPSDMRRLEQQSSWSFGWMFWKTA